MLLFFTILNIGLKYSNLKKCISSQMIIYQSRKDKFLTHLLSNELHEIIEESFKIKTGRRVPKNELRSWQESMRFMGGVLADDEIPNESGVSIEYHIPQTSKRVDFILSGLNAESKSAVVIIELKQWESSELTQKDGIVKTRFQHGSAETSHPSYQAWSYSELLNQLNENVYLNDIKLYPCAYLHNYHPDQVIKNDFYKPYLDKAPVFLEGKEEKEKLKEFIKAFIKYGDKDNLILQIDSGRIRPSKNLADSLASMLKGNDEFIMLDDQKVVYETAMDLARKSSESNKNVLIVEGGPGTGKSVVAINLLVNLINKEGLLAQYATKNAAPRAVYEAKLTGSFKKSAISNFFTGTGSYIDTDKNNFDVLLVDEAHRLNEKSGMFKNLGENQAKEIINAAKCSVFFLDEDQKVTFHDIGSIDEIERWSQRLNANITRLKLESQFRCNGSDGYLAWLDNILGIRDTANYSIKDLDYELKLFDSPLDLQKAIVEKNELNNKSRIVAGYCWDWVSKKDKSKFDIVFPDHGFAMRWNLDTDGALWIQAKDSVSEIGCIHTCQGLELDYVGVIIGKDLVVRDGYVVTNPNARSSHDKSLSGFKKLLKDNPDLAKSKADLIIRNTYRTLMTRGMKGCYIYCDDQETKEYFKSFIN